MIYTFGIFRFETEPATLTRSGRLVPLEPQPARALALLVARAGDLVTRDELRALLWGDDTHVDFDRGLAYCIAQLRSALGDSADSPRFIQTLPRRGYTFIAPVHAVGARPSAPPPTAIRSGEHAVHVNNWISAAAIAVVALAVGAAGALMIAPDRRGRAVRERNRRSVARPRGRVAVGHDRRTADDGRPGADRRRRQRRDSPPPARRARLARGGARHGRRLSRIGTAAVEGRSPLTVDAADPPRRRDARMGTQDFAACRRSPRHDRRRRRFANRVRRARGAPQMTP